MAGEASTAMRTSTNAKYQEDVTMEQPVSTPQKVTTASVQQDTPEPPAPQTSTNAHPTPASTETVAMESMGLPVIVTRVTRGRFAMMTSTNAKMMSHDAAMEEPVSTLSEATAAPAHQDLPEAAATLT